MTKCLLLVEGKTDADIVSALCEENKIVTQFIKKISEFINVDACFAIYYTANSNDQQLLKNISVCAQTDGIEVVGIILDADTHVEGRIQAIREQLKKIHPTLKVSDVQASENGTILSDIGDLKKFGFWIMPDNKNPGMLEDFLMKIVRKPAKCIDLATECVEKAREQQCHTFKDSHFSKAIIHTYLAWQDKPVNSLNLPKLSIDETKFNYEAELAQKLIAWLKSLFDIGST